MKPKYTITKAFLEEQHLIYKKTGKQIAEMVGCTGANISIYFKRSGITNHSNVRTLCAPCHRKTDTYGGRVHNFADGGTIKSVALV